MCNSTLMHQIELTRKLHIPTFYTGSFQNNVNMSRIRLSVFSMRILYRKKTKLFGDQDEDCRIARKRNWLSLPSCMVIQMADFSWLLYLDNTKNWKFKFERIALFFTHMTSLELLRNSQRDYSSSVMLKYIMLQSRGLRANAIGVNEVMLR